VHGTDKFATLQKFTTAIGRCRMARRALYRGVKMGFGGVMRTISKLAAVAVIAVAWAPLRAGPNAQAWCGKDGDTWTIDLAIAAKPAVDCRKIGAVVKAFGLLDERDLPNSQAGGKPKPNTYYAKAVMDLLHRGDGPTCRALTLAVAKTSDVSVALHAVELATLADNAAGTCTSGLKAALGDNPDAKGLLEQAADLCTGRKEPHCALLTKQAQ
jgi:hypothetical protein